MHRELVAMDAFEVMGPHILTARVRGLVARGSRLDALKRAGVDAAVIVTAVDAETVCEEQIWYRKTDKTRKIGRDDRVRGRRDYDTLVWAAKYRTYEYTTTVHGRVEIADTRTGHTLFMDEFSGEDDRDEREDVDDEDYRWYPKPEVKRSLSDRRSTYRCRLDTETATEMMDILIDKLTDRMGARVLLPGPGAPEPAPAPKTTAKVLLVNQGDIYIEYGGEDGARKGDTLSVWKATEVKDPDTGELIETIRERTARLKVQQVYERISRCRLVSSSSPYPTSIKAGARVTLD